MRLRYPWSGYHCLVQVYIAFLRAINVGGRNLIPMAELRALLEGMGFSDVKSLLQSGNVVFRAAGKKPAELESILEREVSEKLCRGGRSRPWPVSSVA